VVNTNVQPTPPATVYTVAVPVIPAGSIALKRPHLTVEKTELPELYQVSETASKLFIVEPY
jgi:hypothetical protein